MRAVKVIGGLLTIMAVAAGCASPEGKAPAIEQQDSTALSDTSTVVDGPQGMPLDSLPYVGGPIKLVPARVHLAKGLDFTLNIPEGCELKVAAEGFERLRFMCRLPDDQLLVTDMHDLTDNKQGKVYLLSGWNADSGRYTERRVLLSGLRNPNQVLVHTDSARHYLYVATTDKLLRYPYNDPIAMDLGAPEVLDTFPSYGLSYKYGGWHLTRSIAFSPDRSKLYVSVGSSCNACIEQEEVRATIIEMDPDGKNKRIYATGLRNAVGLHWVGNALFATEMGSDQFGTEAPEDKLVRVIDGGFYGWPYFYQIGDSVLLDTVFAKPNMRLRSPEPAYVALGPHVAPLGFQFLDEFADERLEHSFLVACHGSSIVPMGKGYAIVRVHKGEKPTPVVTGFLQKGERYGRPCDILSVITGDDAFDPVDAFLFTDDHNGVLYLLRKKED